MNATRIIDHLYIEKVDLEEAKALAGGYDYIIAHMISSKPQIGTPDQVNIDWEELIELHAFGLKGELHVFGAPGELEAVKVEEEEGCSEFLEKDYRMRNQSILRVREYLKSDEDGQAVVVYTRPVAVVKEVQNGGV